MRRRLQHAVVFEAGCEEARRRAQRARGVGAHGWRCFSTIAATSPHPRARRNWFQYSKSSSAGLAGSAWQQQGDGSEDETHQWASSWWSHCNWLLAGLRQQDDRDQRGRHGHCEASQLSARAHTWRIPVAHPSAYYGSLVARPGPAAGIARSPGTVGVVWWL